MSFFDPIFTVVEKFFSSIRPKQFRQAIASFGYLRKEDNPRNYSDLAQDGYQINPTVYSCINYISQAVASVDWVTRTLNRQGEWQDATSHQLTQLLKKPNADQSLGEFILWEMSYFLLAGNSFILLGEKGLDVDRAKPLKKRPDFLWLFRPDSVIPVKSEKGDFVMYYEYAPEVGKKEIIHPTRVIHRKMFHPTNDRFGMSPLDPAAKDTDSDNMAGTFNYALLQNSGRPDGVLTLPKNLTAQERARIKEEYFEGNTGPWNAGKSIVSSGDKGADWKQISMNPKDMEFEMGKLHNKLQICSVFGVPPELIGIPGQKTYNTYQEARKAFYQETVIPHLNMLRGSLRKLARFFGDSRMTLTYIKDAIEALQEDENELWTRYKDAETSGEITNNEYRRALGLDPAEDLLADVRMIPIGRMPATQGFSDPFEDGDEKSIKREVKTVGMLSQRQRTREESDFLWKTFDTARWKWVNVLKRLAGAQLREDYEQYAQGLEAVGGIGASSIVDIITRQQQKAWKETLLRMWSLVSLDFAKAVNTDLKNTSKQMPAISLKQGEEDLWAVGVKEYLDKVGGTKIKHISETTKKKITSIVEAGVREGKSSAEIAGAIRENAKLLEPRATLIARTETIAASNAGSNIAAETSGLRLYKEWIATPDDRTRDMHIEAGASEPIPADQAFDVGGSKLMFPGDISLGAGGEEVINCRCTMAFIPAEDV